MEKDDFIEKLAENGPDIMYYCLQYNLVTLEQIDETYKQIGNQFSNIDDTYKRIDLTSNALMSYFKKILYDDLEKSEKDFKWWAPAGLTKGDIKDTVKLIYNEKDFIDTFGKPLENDDYNNAVNTMYIEEPSLYLKRVEEKIDYYAITKDICGR